MCKSGQPESEMKDLALHAQQRCIRKELGIAIGVKTARAVTYRKKMRQTESGYGE